MIGEVPAYSLGSSLNSTSSLKQHQQPFWKPFGPALQQWPSDRRLAIRKSHYNINNTPRNTLRDTDHPKIVLSLAHPCAVTPAGRLPGTPRNCPRNFHGVRRTSPELHWSAKCVFNTVSQKSITSNITPRQLPGQFGAPPELSELPGTPRNSRRFASGTFIEFGATPGTSLVCQVRF